MQINQKIKGGDIKQLIKDQRSILRSLENIIKLILTNYLFYV